MTFSKAVRATSFITCILSLLSLSASGQLLPEDVKGCYQKRYDFNLDTLIVNGIDINFCLDEHNRFSMTLGMDQLVYHYHGTYSILPGDTLLIKTDSEFHKFELGTKANSRLKKNEIQLAVNDMLDVSVIISGREGVKEYDLNEMEYREKDETYTGKMDFHSGDTLIVSDYYRKYHYLLPTGINDLHLNVNTESSFAEELYAVKAGSGLKIGDSKRELQDADTLFYASFDSGMFSNQRKSNTTPNGYTTLNPVLIKVTPLPEYDDTDSTNAYYDDYDYESLYAISDTLLYSSDFEVAKKWAQDSGRYLILYYEPEGCESCGYFTREKGVQIINDPYNYYSMRSTHAENSVFYFAPVQDSMRFKRYGIESFPATVIRKLNYDSALIFKYLDNFWISGTYQGGEDNYAWYEEYNESSQSDDQIDFVEPAITTADEDMTIDTVAYTNYVEPVYTIKRSKLTLALDTAFTYALMDTLVNRLSDAILHDSTTRNKVLRYFYLLSDTYCPYQSFGKQVLARDAMQFVVDHYAELQPYGVVISEYENPVSVYELVSKKISQGTINTTLIEKNFTALQFQKQMIEQIPAIRHFEMPLYISNLIYVYDSVKHNLMESREVVNYLNSLGGDPARVIAVSDSIQKGLRENDPQAVNYDYSYNYYYWLGGSYRFQDEQIDPLEVYHRIKHAEILNSAAWFYYNNLNQKDGLKVALHWSKSSLVIDPNNPYFLDTYAHLLYRSGSVKDALKYQKKAVAELKSKKLKYDILSVQQETIQADYVKMKKKTL